MRIRGSLLALAASVLCVPTATGLAEFGIEGMGVVSTPADELRATVAPDGQRIVWDSDRAGGPGGLDLWQATLAQGRWSEPQPLALNTPADESAPFFSADGRWLYFVSNRAGGLGGNDLYRAAVTATGIGAVENLGASVNTPGDERAPTLSLDGTRLLFASDGHGGAGRHDLFVAHWSGRAFADPQPVPGTNTDADETEAAWLGDGRALVLARSGETSNPSVQLWLAQCANGRYGEPQPLLVSFNTADGSTRGPVVDANKPGELLISGSARAPKAGKHDIYRIKAPMVTGSDDCR
jgi:Tol biopolymer transport system component